MFLALAALSACGASSAAAPIAGKETGSHQANKTAAKGGATAGAGAISMICAAETRTNVGQQLAVSTIDATPKMVTRGNDHTCTYRLRSPQGPGTFVVSIHRGADPAAASAYLAAERRRDGGPRVALLGSDAFTRTDGTTFTQKDDLVLKVDPTHLPTGEQRTQIAQSISFEILACWTEG